ncbi:MAG: NAD(P)/FAD-dependent oxidoreductase [Lysobacteraceae bacterium]|nr:MAG: NAD(P)/FAD-dependent oxidoreductase [Xanthomonadaceae bacterium]
MKHYAVIGSGPMGLMAAIALLDKGHRVDVYERDDRLGGMSASFDFDGLQIERYYHFICRTDLPLFALLDRYGLSARLKWVDTRMGYFYEGALHPWGTPLALLKFPHLGLLSKLRYAAHVMHTKGIDDWSALDQVNATDWIRKWVGGKAYEVLWRRAFELKFFDYAPALSASWIGTRIKRIALSRRSLMHESLGYLEGGSDALLAEMARDLRARGGNLFLGRGVEEVVCADGRVSGIRSAAGLAGYDGVLSTAPIQYVPRMVPALPADFVSRIEAIDNIPVACVILKLGHPLSANFWMNISDRDIDIPGVIEFSNLNPCAGQHVLYAPFYMPKTHPKWSRSNQELIDEVIGYLPRLNPGFRPDWVLASHCHRYEFAQPICPPGFQRKLPPMRTPVAGFYMADTAYYYPEDRSISESLRVGNELAQAVHAGEPQ